MSEHSECNSEIMYQLSLNCKPEHALYFNDVAELIWFDLLKMS